MKTAVHLGAGNIGRGFLGQLYWQSGWRTVFVDVLDEVVEALNRRGCYPVHLVDERPQVLTIDRVRALHSRDAQAVSEALAACDLASVSVGVANLARVAPLLAQGIERRARTSHQPLDVVVCENLLDAAQRLRECVLAQSPQRCQPFVRQRVGFVATVVSRMVPVVPEEVRAEDPLHVAVEAYATLPVDATAFVGGVPHVEGFLPVTNIEAHQRRKLFCHNCGHALCAYAGHRRGHALVADAIADPPIREHVQAGLAETGRALIARDGFEPAEHQAHIDDLLRRFANRALGDTVARVGRDPIRKLGPNDRLVGAARFCLDAGVEPTHVVRGVADALAYDNPQDAQAVRLQQMLRREGLDAVLHRVCGLQPGQPLTTRIREIAQ
ncbi:MAG: mannitol-1-phosphate 5-dehydrogenase [Candidatus Brocadiia bacterium]